MLSQIKCLHSQKVFFEGFYHVIGIIGTDRVWFHKILHADVLAVVIIPEGEYVFCKLRSLFFGSSGFLLFNSFTR